jgi:O-acetyl-ADP-ribose deacetylase (regulator of RNase III)
MTMLAAIRGDLTALRVDAIVNAANTSLEGGGGVDGAIHRAAGPELLAACRLLGGCPVGEARITRGYRLPATHVIHTVAPYWQMGTGREREDLANCYRACLRLAEHHHLTSVAFPCIGTGAHGFPGDLACEIALRAIGEAPTTVEQILFCCFGLDDLLRYERALEPLRQRQSVTVPVTSVALAAVI